MLIKGTNISIEPLLKAYAMFCKMSQSLTAEVYCIASIQTFEYTFELCWKSLKRVLDFKGKIVNSPRAIFREAALEGLITDPEIWFDFLEKRNLTVHSYNEDVFEEVVDALPQFKIEAQKLINTLQALQL